MSLFAEQTELTGATFSECGVYRYHLWRVWNQELPIMVFVMQNPSTADATENDPTIRRCIGFAKRDGFGGISVRNVFALRATDERVLLTHPDPFGPDNEQHLLAARNVSLMTRLVAAWGNRLAFKKGSRHRDMYCKAANACAMQHAYCLGTTKSGDPCHPLFLPKNRELIPWKSPGY